MITLPQNQLDRLFWTKAKNRTGEDIPAYSLVEVTGVEEDSLAFEIRKLSIASGTGFSPLATTGSVIIPAQSYGLITQDTPAVFSYAGSASYGDLFGPATGEFELSKGKSGYVFVGSVAEGVGLFTSLPYGIIRATASATITAGSSGTVATLSGQSLQAKNWLTSTSIITSQKLIIAPGAEEELGKWVIISAECD